MQIPARHADTADMDFTFVAWSDRLAVCVEQMDTMTVDGAADRHRDGVRVRIAQMHGRPDGGFGRAIRIEHAPTSAPTLHQCRGQRLTRADQHLHRGERIVRQTRQHDGRQRDMGDAVARDQCSERLAGQHIASRAQMQRRAMTQRHRPFEDAGIETERGELQHATRGRNREQLALHTLEIRQAAMRHHHALGPAGRSRGVDHVREVIRREPGERQRRRMGWRLRPQPRIRLAVDHTDRGNEISGREHTLDQWTAGGIGQHHDRARIRSHERQSIDRIRRIQRHIRAAGFQHAKHRFDRVERTRHANGHQYIGPDTLRHEVMRQPIGADIQRPIGRTRVAAYHSTCIWITKRLPLESRMRTLPRKLHPDSPCFCHRKPQRSCATAVRLPAAR